jgi:hypothetical protein
MVLTDTWFIEGHIDFELQKYRLLAYLKEVNQYFTQTKLYPQLSDIVFHFNNLVKFRDNKSLMDDSFPQRLDKVQMEQLKLVYKKMVADEEMMDELERIVNYALAKMKPTIDTGAEIYELIEHKLHIAPVGIVPLYKDEGYMLLCAGLQEIRAYSYSITILEHKDARYRGINMTYLDTWSKSIANTYSQIKRDIIMQNRALPTPAVYSIETELSVPINETLLPIAKRALVQHIAHAA